MRHQTSCDDLYLCIEKLTELNLFQLAVDCGVKNTENPFRVLITSDARELKCWKAY